MTLNPYTGPPESRLQEADAWTDEDIEDEVRALMAAGADLSYLDDVPVEKAFDPDEARDERGRWTSVTSMKDIPVGATVRARLEGERPGPMLGTVVGHRGKPRQGGGVHAKVEWDSGSTGIHVPDTLMVPTPDDLPGEQAVDSVGFQDYLAHTFGEQARDPYHASNDNHVLFGDDGMPKYDANKVEQDHVFRVMSDAEYQAGIKSGSFSSNESGNWRGQGVSNESEGTVAGRWVYPGYLFSDTNAPQRVVQFDVRPGDGWQPHPIDEEGGYVQTFRPIPANRVSAVTPPIVASYDTDGHPKFTVQSDRLPSGQVKKYSDEEARDDHGRWVHGADPLGNRRDRIAGKSVAGRDGALKVAGHTVGYAIKEPGGWRAQYVQIHEAPGEYPRKVTVDLGHFSRQSDAAGAVWRYRRGDGVDFRHLTTGEYTLPTAAVKGIAQHDDINSGKNPNLLGEVQAKGITEPLEMSLHSDERGPVLRGGSHRVNAAAKLKIPVVPVRVIDMRRSG